MTEQAEVAAVPKELRVEVEGWEATLEWSGRDPARASLEPWRCGTLVHFDLPTGALGEYHLCVRQPMVDIHHSWVGNIDQWRGSELTSVALDYTFESRANSAIPIVCNYDRTGQNRGVIALLDTAPPTQVHQRVLIDQPPMRWLRTRFRRSRREGGLRETLVLHRNRVHFATAVSETLRELVHRNHITPLTAPDWAREPVWCSWYSHLYRLTEADVEAQIPHLEALGIRTMILDASWFKTPDTSYGDIWGDYQVERSLVPDLPGLVRRLHNAGRKLMLWCAPLYVGHKAKARARLEPYCAFDGKNRHDRLCPFCPESIAHAAALVERLMRMYQLDGLKLDFLDQGDDPPCVEPAHDHGDGDYGRAMLRFMAGVRQAIRAINPDAAIEYRIGYSTLNTLNVANCHRGNDAPYDADYMRRENQFLRLFCHAPAAVWNDYAYWHADESAENVSLMMGQQIFSGGVPTLSVDLTRLSEAHRRAIARWLEFYQEHRPALARATLVVHSADSCFSVASLQDPVSGVAYVLIAGSSIPARLHLQPGIREAWVLNASAETAGRVTLAFDAGAVDASITDREPRCYKLT